MHRIPSFYRTVAAGSLVATAGLSVVSVALQPDVSGSGRDQLAAIDAAGATAAISVATFVLAQLFFAPGVLAIAHLLRQRSARLGSAVAILAFVGAFGHTVIGGVRLLSVTMAGSDRGADRAVLGRALDDFLGSPAMMFAVLGLAGTVLSTLLLAIGLWRAGLGARWVPAALVGFLVLEFAAGGLTRWASLGAAALYLAAFVALAGTLLDGSADAGGTAGLSRRTTEEAGVALT
ncbi:MAG: hypothetical protein ACXV3C_12275 [Actinomycetes bacterium]